MSKPGAQVQDQHSQEELTRSVIPVPWQSNSLSTIGLIVIPGEKRAHKEDSGIMLNENGVVVIRVSTYDKAATGDPAEQSQILQLR